MSKPGARVRSTSRASVAAALTHTPSWDAGRPAPPMRSARSSTSPVGSDGTSGFASSPAGEASRSSEFSSAVRSAAVEKCSRVHGGTQQVAMLEHERAIRRGVGVVAVVDRGETRVGAQPSRERAARLRELVRRGTADPGEHQSRHHAVAELVHEQLLRRRRHARQEGGQVGREAGLRDDTEGGDQEQQPESRRRCAYESSRTIVITERSPSDCSTSTVPISPPLPVMRITRTTDFVFASAGSSLSRQPSAPPSNSTR